ncbi:Ger(x)C family spore germination protein [Cohnella massiliensis]|uniref:Ger(x)C family spore germination protein n=1 Tax=Cohnella massiliensis TaxID=1816691 RepID=UPI0009BB4A32|nr:Ger(x)C family spore germination protein [Cohnella massiliensis]
MLIRSPRHARLLRVSPLLAVMLLLGGCWSRVEVNDRLFVSVMLVDAAEKEDEITLTLGFPLPNRLTRIQQGNVGGDGNPYATVTRTGPTIAAAYRKMQTEVSRQINWGHTRVLIVGERFARRGIEPLLEFVMRQPSFQSKAYVFLSEGDARNIIMMTPIYEQFPTEIIRELAARRSLINTTVRDLLIGGPDVKDGLIGKIDVSAGRLVSEKGKPGNVLKNTGSGILSDYKLVGSLNPIQQRGAMWINGQMRDALVTIESPTDGKLVDFMVVKAESGIKVKARNGRIVFQIHVEAVDDVTSSNSDIDILDPKKVDQLQARLRKDIERRILAVLDYSQTIGVDMFQLGRYVEWYYPSIWNRWKDRWREHYRNDVDFEIRAHIVIERPGGVGNSFWIRDREEERK